MAEGVSGTIVVDADVDAIMDVIADFEAYPEWQDEIKDVEILETDDDGWGTRVRFTVDAKLFRTWVELVYSYEETAMRWQLAEGGHVRKNDGAYLLEPLEDGSTEVTYELEIDPAVSVPGWAKRKAAQRIVDGALTHMKERVEAQTNG